jgi:hypothetical protein
MSLPDDFWASSFDDFCLEKRDFYHFIRTLLVGVF